MVVLEDYKCCNDKCSHEWKAPTSMQNCPKCGSKYVEWVSFSKWEYNETTEKLERVK